LAPIPVIVARHGGEPVDFTIGNGGAGLLLIGAIFVAI
jgi:hypothetical protein